MDEHRDKLTTGVGSNGTCTAQVERFCWKTNSMKLLYVNPVRESGPIMALLVRRGHEVTCVEGTDEALDVIGTQRFSAVLIADEIEDSEAFEFISKVHHGQPELLVFQLSVWRSELAETLELLETIEKGRDAPQ